jgi:hypothetical protein
MAGKKVSIDRDVLSVLVTAAEVRRDQWKRSFEGEPPADLVNELYEADEDESWDMINILSAALNQGYKALKANR